MKSLVVYYSRTGATKKVAETISSSLESDIEEIEDIKNRKGIIGYIISGYEAVTKKCVKIKGQKKNPTLYDTVIIGTPIWAFTISSPIRAYLLKNKTSFKKIAFFCTEGGSGGSNTFKEMGLLCGKKPVAMLELKTKEVKDGIYKNKIKKFVELIKNKF